MLSDPAIACPDDENLATLSSEYLVELEKWILGEIKAKSIIATRLTSTTCPQNYDHMTAKGLYETVAGTRPETATAPYSTALEKLHLSSYPIQIIILTNSHAPIRVLTMWRTHFLRTSV